MSDVLHIRDIDVLDALQHDRDESGPGLTLAQIETVGVTRWPHRIVGRLIAAGHPIGLVGERYQLAHENCRPSVNSHPEQEKYDQPSAARPGGGAADPPRLFREQAA